VADGLTIQEAHEKTGGVSPSEVHALVVEMGIDEREIHDYALGAIIRVQLGGDVVAGAIAVRAFLAGVLWEKSRGDS
jgi:hypothetical protein